MATAKITVTLPDSQIQEIRDLVAVGRASSVSAFVQHSVAVGLADAAGWREMLDDALNQTGGPLTQDEIRWADSILNAPVPPVRGNVAGGAQGTAGRHERPNPRCRRTDRTGSERPYRDRPH